jgi:hypothetical protein
MLENVKRIFICLLLVLTCSLAYASLEKEIETQVTVLADGQLNVLTITKIIEDGIEISRANHRKVIAPNEDTSKEDVLVQDIAQGVHTKARKDTYTAKKEAQELERG